MYAIWSVPSRLVNLVISSVLHVQDYCQNCFFRFTLVASMSRSSHPSISMRYLFISFWSWIIKTMELLDRLFDAWMIFFCINSFFFRSKPGALCTLLFCSICIQWSPRMRVKPHLGNILHHLPVQCACRIPLLYQSSTSTWYMLVRLIARKT
jgi:hypothetical protein